MQLRIWGQGWLLVGLPGTLKYMPNLNAKLTSISNLKSQPSIKNSTILLCANSQLALSIQVIFFRLGKTVDIPRMVRKQCFHLSILKRKWLRNFLVIVKAMTSKHDFHSDLYLETDQKKQLTTTNTLKKKQQEKHWSLVVVTVVIFCFSLCDLIL